MTKINKIHTVIYSVLVLALIVLAVMWLRAKNSEERLNTAVNNSYDRAFFQMCDYVSDIDALLSKAQLASTPAQMASISNEIFMQSAEAKSCFGQLPSQNTNLENTARFLSQVGDYTYVLSQNMINGQGISDKEYQTLNELNQYASKLSKKLDEIKSGIYKGEMSFAKAETELGMTEVNAANDIFTDMENVEKSFEGYPSLIYDGPFSEHIENMQSQMLMSAPEISRDEAKKKAEEFLGGRGKKLEFETDMQNTAIEAYVFGKTEGDNHLTISVTKRGGYILYFLENREAKEYNYDVASATELAMKFLEEKGFTNMVDSYYEIADNIATINFAYSQDGVKCYSDLIKVRVALDDGTIIGIECKGYLMNHRQRDVSNIVLTEAQAEERVSTHLEVEGVSLAIVPKDSMREVLCYEFKGTYMDKNFIIYINAENGREEEIMLLIESESGILTI